MSRFKSGPLFLVLLIILGCSETRSAANRSAGATGQAGPKGDTGPQGPVGPQGPEGPRGAVGPAGPTGAGGPVGPVGPTGPSGPAGATGARGATGATGPQGPQGPAGVSSIHSLYQNQTCRVYRGGEVHTWAGGQYIPATETRLGGVMIWMAAFCHAPNNPAQWYGDAVSAGTECYVGWHWDNYGTLNKSMQNPDSPGLWEFGCFFPKMVPPTAAEMQMINAVVLTRISISCCR